MLFPATVIAIQFVCPFLLAIGYGLMAAIGNADSVESLVGGVWLSFGHICGSVVPYFASIPCYVSLMHLYSISRLHDLSWGTRDTSSGEDVAARQEAIDTVSSDFSRDVLLYNGLALASGFLLDLMFGPLANAIILSIVIVVVVSPMLIHVIGSFVHFAIHFFGFKRTIVLLVMTICVVVLSQYLVLWY